MRVLLLTDTHGKLPNFNQREKFDLTLFTGDIGDDTLIKDIFFEWLNKYLGKKTNLSFERYINNPRLLIEYEKNRFNTTIEILQKLNKLSRKVIIVHGNNDDYYEIKYLIKALNLNNIILLNKLEYYEYREFIFLGYGGTSSNEINKLLPKRIYLREKIIHRIMIKKFEAIIKKFNNKKIIILSHNSPHKIMDKIGEEVKVLQGKENGSSLIKELIKRNNILINVFGHYHHYQDSILFNKTICINPGYGHIGKFSILDINNNSIKIKFYKNKRLIKEKNYKIPKYF